MKNKEIRYFYCRLNGAEAKGFVSENGFTIVDGSHMSWSTTHALEYDPRSDLRDFLSHQGKTYNGYFNEDFEFEREDDAAGVITGDVAFDADVWVDADGISLGESGIVVPWKKKSYSKR